MAFLSQRAVLKQADVTCEFVEHHFAERPIASITPVSLGQLPMLYILPLDSANQPWRKVRNSSRRWVG